MEALELELSLDDDLIAHYLGSVQELAMERLAQDLGMCHCKLTM